MVINRIIIERLHDDGGPTDMFRVQSELAGEGFSPAIIAAHKEIGNVVLSLTAMPPRPLDVDAITAGVQAMQEAIKKPARIRKPAAVQSISDDDPSAD